MKTLIVPAWALWRREMVRFFRQRSRVMGALATPIIFWLIIGGGVGESFRAPDFDQKMHYMEFYFPGTLLMIVLFTAIFSTISIIEDRNAGFLQSVLVAPISPMAIVLGKVGGGASIAVVQALLFYAISPFFGLPLSAGIFLETVAVLVLVSVMLTALGYALAWPMNSTHAYHGIMNVFLLPMWLLSGALFTYETASTWLRPIMLINPLAYSLDALRLALYSGEQTLIHEFLHTRSTCYLVLAFCTLALLILCTHLTRKTFRG